MTESIGRLSAVMLNVEDMDKACAFYRDTMGLTLKFRDGDRYAAFDAGGVTLALAGQSERGASPVALNFKVADLPAALDRLAAGGARLESGPVEGPHEKRAALRDRDGHAINLFMPLRT
jgi:catechol 2,3-dioxygenase-like lactoylglutathione lyase family enzyme